jgi:hypothetical protein
MNLLKPVASSVSVQSTDRILTGSATASHHLVAPPALKRDGILKRLRRPNARMKSDEGSMQCFILGPPHPVTRCGHTKCAVVGLPNQVAVYTTSVTDMPPEPTSDDHFGMYGTRSTTVGRPPRSGTSDCMKGAAYALLPYHIASSMYGNMTTPAKHRTRRSSRTDYHRSWIRPKMLSSAAVVRRIVRRGSRRVQSSLLLFAPCPEHSPMFRRNRYRPGRSPQPSGM